MQTASDTVHQPEVFASRTCAACKARKRKCGRELPSCNYCQRKNVACDYSKTKNKALTQTSAHKHALSGVTIISANGSRESTVPAVYFLDLRLFQQSPVEISKITLVIPSSVLSLVGDITTMRLVASQYFESIHIWLPFISKMRFYKNVLNPLSQPRADAAFLLLCMRLITWSPSESEDADNPQTWAYLTAKRFLLDIELTGVLTLQVAQASILLTLYELGHAIYPSAYISIGTCIRYLMVLCIDGKRRSHTTDISLWMTHEEQRRTWWTVIILDRFVLCPFILAIVDVRPCCNFANLGCPERPLSTPDLGPDDLLPVDDVAWGQGTITYNDNSMVFSPANIHMGMFARFAQATNLVSYTLRHVSDKATSDTLHTQEATQLDRAIRSLVHLTKVEGQFWHTTTCLQAAVCYSALMVLNASESLTIRQALSDEIIVISKALLFRITENARSGDNASPLLLYWAYHAASTYVSLYRETGREKHLRSWEVLKQTLSTLNKRWMVARAYIHILEAKNALETS